MPLTTETGREFATAESAVEFIREQERILLRPDTSTVQSNMATIEMLYTFRALDEYLVKGGTLPIGWSRAVRPGEKV